MTEGHIETEPSKQFRILIYLNFRNWHLNSFPSFQGMVVASWFLSAGKAALCSWGGWRSRTETHSCQHTCFSCSSLCGVTELTMEGFTRVDQ